VFGHGVGSWAVSVRPFEGDTYVKRFGATNSSNPHQEYLLWGVEVGLMGIALLIGIFIYLAREAAKFPQDSARAAWSLIAALGISCMFNSTLYDALIGDYFCVAIGLCVALGIQQSKPDLQSSAHAA
jgi:O-antigen ligase